PRHRRSPFRVDGARRHPAVLLHRRPRRLRTAAHRPRLRRLSAQRQPPNAVSARRSILVALDRTLLRPRRRVVVQHVVLSVTTHAAPAVEFHFQSEERSSGEIFWLFKQKISSGLRFSAPPCES